mmetsp:Transcript_20762/g.54071  ORF Transcript_20762/g.54071 Transcript_20762/m.54071 type:complete len:217 (+) Transcript_20762:333-983(+)
MSMCLEAISKLQQLLHKRLNGRSYHPAQVQQQCVDFLLDLMIVLRQAALNRSKKGLQAHRPQGQDQHALAALRHARRLRSNWDPAMLRDVAEHRPRHERVVHRLNLLLQNGQHQGSPLQRRHAAKHLAVPLVQVHGPLAVRHVTVFARLALFRRSPSRNTSKADCKAQDVRHCQGCSLVTPRLHRPRHPGSLPTHLPKRVPSAKSRPQRRPPKHRP